MDVLEMSPETFRKIRQNLGMTQLQLAAYLGWKQVIGIQTYEAAKGANHHKPIGPRLAMLMLLLDDWNAHYGQLPDFDRLQNAASGRDHP